jgi:hypothetical protein
VQSAPGGASLSALKEGKSKNEQLDARPLSTAPCAGWKIWRRLVVYSIVTMYE